MKTKLYERYWFVMIFLFSPLFPVGLFLLWRLKSVHYVMKILFTAVYSYAIIITVQNTDFSIKGKEDNIISASEYHEQHQESKNISMIVSYIAEHEDVYGEYHKAEELKKGKYLTKTSVGEYTILIKDNEVKKVKKNTATKQLTPKQGIDKEDVSKEG